MNNLLYIILDSCRYDTFVRAKTPHMQKIGQVGKRYSYASWTSPSHYTFLMGLTPHTSPSGVYASEIYKEDFKKWIVRLDVPELSFKSFVPYLSLPKKLKELGYKTVAKISLPVLNEFTTINTYFDDYKLMENHNDFAGMVEEIRFFDDAPTFYFLNLGETHYPYMLKGDELPHLSGVHGVFKHLDDLVVGGEEDKSNGRFFTSDEMRFLFEQQIKCVEYVDKIFGQLMKSCPANTYFIITSDHGELFGEDGYFGHGPVMHEKVFEVPYLEGPIPKKKFLGLF